MAFQQINACSVRALEFAYTVALPPLTVGLCEGPAFYPACRWIAVRKSLQGYHDVEINLFLVPAELSADHLLLYLETDEKTCDVLEMGAFSDMDKHLDIIRGNCF